MKNILNKLFEHQRLSRAEAYDALTMITKGEANEAQIAAFLTVYLMRSISIEELDGFRQALLDLCVPFDLGGLPAVDLCGTGGDGKNTFNISTLASFVVAGAGGKVVKHGNYGVSSVCGSSNVLEALGYRFTNDTGVLRRQLDEAGICFLHAPLFHPALKSVGPVRRALGIKTFFNMLGPIVNPARPVHQFTGVFSLELLRLYGYLMQEDARKGERSSFCVVHTIGGYDEISLTAPVMTFTEAGPETLDPVQLGGQVTEQEIAGGDSIEANARLFTDILDGRGTPAQNRVVLANAAAALRCCFPKESLDDCLARAEESLQSGRAKRALEKLVARSW